MLLTVTLMGAVETGRSKETFVFTNNHPDGESDPRAHVQLHHEVDVDQNTEQGQPGKQGDLERTERKKKKQVSITKLVLEKRRR